MNVVFAGICIVALISEYNLSFSAGTTGSDAALLEDFAMPHSSSLFKLLGLGLLFGFVSLLDGEPRWAANVRLRGNADIGVRIGSLSLPLLLFVNQHAYFWPVFFWSLTGSMSLLYNKAPLNRSFWLPLLPFGSAIFAALDVFEMDSPVYASHLKGAPFLYYLLSRVLRPSQISAFASGLAYWLTMRVGLRQLPHSFTWGEAHLIAQMIGLGVAEWMQLSWMRNASMIQALTISLTLGMLAIGVLSWYLLKKHAEAPSQNYALAFYAIFALLVFAVIQPWIFLVTGNMNPWMWTIRFIIGTPAHYALFAYWLALLLLVLFVFDLPSWSARYPLIIVRKFYHMLAFAMFCPGLIFAPEFLALSYAVALSALLAVEWIRFGNIPPFGETFRGYISALVDSRDCGPLVTTHIYLLVGCAFPLWFSSTNGRQSELAPFVGLLSLGIGDTLASLVGINFGRNKWPSSNKTIEGTLAGIVGVCITGFFCFQTMVSSDVLVLIGCSVLVMVLEAVTNQIDNLFLPLWFLIFFSTTRLIF